ncbi:MAG TPA: NAD(P)-binding domain-containing protein, partial [Stellaceae bacterium]
MSTPRLSDLRRRDFLRFVGSAAALFAFASSPFAAFAQTAPGGAPLKIGTIGAGREGGALGTVFAKAGHPVMFSSRHPEQLKDLVASAGPNAKAGTVKEAVDFADVVLLVVPYSAIEEIGKEYGPGLAKKQLVMDVSNPIPQRDGEELVKSVNDQGGAG